MAAYIPSRSYIHILGLHLEIRGVYHTAFGCIGPPHAHHFADTLVTVLAHIIWKVRINSQLIDVLLAVSNKVSGGVWAHPLPLVQIQRDQAHMSKFFYLKRNPSRFIPIHFTPDQFQKVFICTHLSCSTAAITLWLQFIIGQPLLKNKEDFPHSFLPAPFDKPMQYTIIYGKHLHFTEGRLAT